MVNKFISGLSSTEKKILAVASVFVILALFDRLLFAPSVNRLKQIDDSIAKEENSIRQNLQFLGYRDRIIKDAGVFKDYYAKDVRAEEEVIAEFLKKVEVMATQSKMQMSKIAPAGQDYQKDYIKYFVSLDCSGTLEDLTNFVYKVNNTNELLKVEKMNLVGSTKSAGNVTASLTISKMIIGADPSVDVKKLIQIKADNTQPKAGTITE